MDNTWIEQRDTMRGEAVKARAAVDAAEEKYRRILEEFTTAKAALVKAQYNPPTVEEGPSLDRRIEALEAERTLVNQQILGLQRERTELRRKTAEEEAAPKALYTRLLKDLTAAKAHKLAVLERAKVTWSQGRHLEVAKEPTTEPLALWQDVAVPRLLYPLGSDGPTRSPAPVPPTPMPEGSFLTARE